MHADPCVVCSAAVLSLCCSRMPGVSNGKHLSGKVILRETSVKPWSSRLYVSTVIIDNKCHIASASSRDCKTGCLCSRLVFCLVAFSALTLLVGLQEGHPACKNMGDGGGGHWLVWMEWRRAGWSVCLPLLIFPCTIKSRSSLLAPAHPGGPGKRAVKRLWWCGVVVFCLGL